MQKSWKNAAYGLAPHGLARPAFLHHPGQLSQGGTTQEEVRYPTSILTHGTACPQANKVGVFSQLKFPLLKQP